MCKLDQSNHPLIQMLLEHGIESKCVLTSEPSLEDDMIEIVFPKDPEYTVGIQILGMGEYMVFKSRNKAAYYCKCAEKRNENMQDLILSDVKSFLPDNTGAVELKDVLVEFVSDIESAGGLVKINETTFAPCSDPSWTDIGSTAIKARDALKKVGVDVDLTIAEQ